MRIVGLVLLVSLLATLGLLACAAPVATPAPAATPAPTAVPPGYVEYYGYVYTPIPTPPPPTPRPGQTLLSTATVNWGALPLSRTLALKTGDVVVFTFTLTGTAATMLVVDPAGAAALQATTFFNNASGTRSFQAKMDGDYRLTGGVGSAGGSEIVLKIDIYR